MFKCYDCSEKFREIEDIYEHIKEEHPDKIPMDYSVEQYYYYRRTGKTHGNCVQCKRPTEWNEKTNKYKRFCEDAKCKEDYRKEFEKRMIKARGKIHLLNDPEQQRKMLENRSISGKYKWTSGGETSYTGSYELHFLKYLDLIFGYGADDIISPSPHNYSYNHNGVDRFYFPDFYIPDLDLEVEIKDGGKNPNNHHKIKDVDKVKEKLKDEVLMSQKAFHYIKVTDKNPVAFLKFLEKRNELISLNDNKKRIFIVDNKSTNPELIIKESVETVMENISLVNDLYKRIEGDDK